MKKTGKRKAITIISATMLSAAMGFTAHAGWESDEGGTKYLYDSNAYARSEVTQIDGVTYAFDANAYLMYGWQNINGSWHYFDEESGAMAIGWLESDGNWYYMDTDTGNMHTGWLDTGAKKYYMDKSGVMQTGTFSVEGSPYLYEAYEDGSLITNLLEDENESETGIAYWHREDGTIVYKTSNTQMLDNSWQTLMASDYQDKNIEDQQAQLYDKIVEKKDQLYEKYMEKVYTAKSSKKWQKRLASWEESVQKGLSALGVSQEDINGFINDVKAGTYEDGDEADDYDD